MGFGGTIGALALLGCNGGMLVDPPGSNADEPSLDSQLVLREFCVLYWAPIFFQ